MNLTRYGWKDQQTRAAKRHRRALLAYAGTAALSVVLVLYAVAMAAILVR